MLAQTISKAIYPELVHAKNEALVIARRMANVALVGGVLAVLLTLFAGRWGLTTITGAEFSGILLGHGNPSYCRSSRACWCKP